MGTHPIFESDFDCLTDQGSKLGGEMSDDCPPEKKQKMDEEEQQLLDVRKQQEGLDELNEKASEEILGVEKKFNKLRKPLFAKRQEMIRKLEKQCDTKFWWSSFQRHPMLSPMLSSEEEAILGYLSEIEVVDNDDIKSGYEIKSTFDKNPFFSNSVLSKCFFVTEDGEVNNSSPTIEWHTGKNILAVEEDEEESGHEFFDWLSRTHDEATDEIADIIKDDLWSNPYQYFVGTADENDEMEDIEEEEEE